MAVARVVALAGSTGISRIRIRLAPFNLPGTIYIPEKIETGDQRGIFLCRACLARKGLLGRGIDVDAEIAKSIEDLGLVPVDSDHNILMLHLGLDCVALVLKFLDIPL
jgi:hypothetical protein